MERGKKALPDFNIYLTGFMGSGKSTVARCFAREYRRELLEMDAYIEEKEARSISAIFSESGEEYFRTLETNLLISLEKRKNLVVSCGGGAVMRPENVEAMKRGGRVIYLRATPETIYERVRYSHNRPLLEGNMNVDYISRLMEQRKGAYEAAASITVDTDGKTISAICSEIAAHLKGIRR